MMLRARAEAFATPEAQPQALDPIAGHSRASGYVADPRLRDDDGTNPGTLPVDRITGNRACDSRGTIVALAVAPGEVQVQRHGFMGTGTNGQSLVVRR